MVPCPVDCLGPASLDLPGIVQAQEGFRDEKQHEEGTAQ
jgi:hypothetical protein